ncbi:uncharacterized protein BDR25DRAFT_241062, partial [Lindgomyces ingoldianus]
ILYKVLNFLLSSKVKMWQEKKGYTGLHIVKGIKALEIIIKIKNSLVRLYCTQVILYYYIKDKNKPA